MTLKELDRADTRQEYKGQDSQYLVRKFKYTNPFRLQFRYRHQIYDNKNRKMLLFQLRGHGKLGSDTGRNFTWYLAVTEMHIALVDGHFCKGGKLIPTFQLCRKLAHEIVENTIGVNTLDSEIPRRSTCKPYIVPWSLQKFNNHEGSYDKRQKNQKVKQKYQKERCANFKTCNHCTRSYCKCTLCFFIFYGCFIKHEVWSRG